MSVCVRANVCSLLWRHFISILLFCLCAQSEFGNATHTLKLRLRRLQLWRGFIIG